MKRTLLLLNWLVLATPMLAAETYADRFVWVFGWGLGKDNDVAEITRLFQAAGSNGYNGAVVSFGLDTLCQQSPDYFRRLEQVQAAAKTNHLELIPAIFSIGYGGGILSHDRNLAEGLAVEEAPFLVRAGEARLVATDTNLLRNGNFEDFKGNTFKHFDFHDQPGEISFVDSEVKHGGNAALRLEHFTANPHGHARIMQTLKVQPHRCYRLTLWAKTENLAPTHAFQVEVLVGDRELAPRQFNLPASTDWRKITMLFNSLDFHEVRVYAGLWGGKSGKLWLDDWTVTEVGPVNPLHRPGTPFAVRTADGATTYSEGKDYTLADPSGGSRWRDDHEAAVLKIPAGSRIQDGQKLGVSWYHSMVIHDSQVTVCMAEPAVYEIFDHEAKLLADHLHPHRIMLNMDEIRMGGTCAACRGQNMGELLGRCVTRQTELLRKHNPGAEIYIWSDMLDPNHNAHGNYYLVEGDFTGSWLHVPKDLIMAVWGGEPREKDLRFLSGQGFRTLVSCYYDANDLKDVQGWLAVARQLPNVRGFMYTPWEKKYALVPAFADLLWKGEAKTSSQTTGGWVKPPGNLVMGGKYGTCFDVSVLKEDHYRMWLSWRPQGSVALVESPDGFNWSEPPRTVLGPNKDTGWEDAINRPVVLKRADGYHMWYTGQAKGHSAIGYATSPDGVIWKRMSDQPVLAPEAAWEKVAVMCPHVLWDQAEGQFRMWYSGGEQNEPNAIGYAVSTNGLNWTRHQANPVFTPEPSLEWEKHKVTACQVERRGDWYVMFYIGFRDEPHAQIGLARSRDGITHWQRHPANPIIRPGAGEWDQDACYKPYALYDGNRWLLWYNGRRDALEQIGVAVHEGEDLGF